MSTQLFPWKRCWYKNEKRVQLSHEGFFLDEDRNTVILQNIEKNIEHKCVILLGEPGMGKSHEIFALREYLVEMGKIVKYFNLRSYGDESRLYNDLFSWKYPADNSEERLFLLLDSFDECLLQMPTLTDIFADNIDKIDRPGLKIFIACRTGFWPKSFQDELTKIWGEAQINIYHIAPLTKEDVINALDISGINSEEFLSKAKYKGLIPLLITPVTLKLLINIYLKNNKLPSTSVEAYKQGCEKLCDETNKTRKTKLIQKKLNSERRFEISAKIAAISIFSQRFLIYKDFENSAMNCLALNDLNCISQEKICFEEWNDVLSTGLFSGYDEIFMSWSHQTYPEFLAAYYVVNNMTDDQIINLLTHIHGSYRRIPPQLHHTAAWIVGMKPQLFYKLLSEDPDLIYICDLYHVTEKDKALIVDKVLKIYAFDHTLARYGNNLLLKKLNHSGLSEQVKALILDKKNSEYGRRIGLIIAGTCKLTSLKEDVFQVFATSNGYLCETALHTFISLTADEDRLRLKPYALMAHDYSICQYIVKNLWPDNISINEIIDILKRLYIPSEKIRKYFDEFLKIFNLDKLGFIGKKLLDNLGLSNKSENIDIFIDSFIYNAWDYLDQNKSLLDIVTKLMIKRVTIIGKIIHSDSYINFNGSFLRKVQSSDIIRRIVLEKMCENQTLPEVSILCGRSLIYNQDLNWVIEKCNMTDDDTSNNYWTTLLNHINESIEQDKNDSSSNGGKLESLLNSLTLLINNCSGNWIELIKQGGWKFKELILKGNLLSRPVWNNLEKDCKLYMINCAKAYINHNKLVVDNWYFEDGHSDISSAGHLAFRFLYEVEPDYINDIPASIWESWSPIIIDYPNYIFNFGDDKINIYLLKKVYAVIPNKIFEDMSKLLDQLDKGGFNFYLIYKIEDIWDLNISEFFYNKVQGLNLEPQNMVRIIGLLFKHGNKNIRLLLENMILTHINGEKFWPLIGACALVSYSEDAGWSFLWPQFQNNTEFGTNVFTNLLEDKNLCYYISNLFNNNCFSEIQLSELYKWVCENEFSTDKIKYFKREIIDRLARRKTKQAYQEIYSIHLCFPEEQYVAKILKLIENDFIAKSWEPYHPSVILKMVFNNQLQPIHTGEQLVLTLLYALKRIERKIRTETPIVEMFWNEMKEIFIPKDENAFSNIIKNLLEYELDKNSIILNREVEIRSSEPYWPGQRLDIKVEVAGYRGSETIKVFIEVKGCWNKSLKSAMETQLVEKYLIENQCKYGVYLIAWFLCDAWQKSDDYRIKDTPQIKIEDARLEYKKQASSLSERYGVYVESYVFDATLS